MNLSEGAKLGHMELRSQTSVDHFVGRNHMERHSKTWGTENTATLAEVASEVSQPHPLPLPTPPIRCSPAPLSLSWDLRPRHDNRRHLPWAPVSETASPTSTHTQSAAVLHSIWALELYNKTITPQTVWFAGNEMQAIGLVDLWACQFAEILELRPANRPLMCLVLRSTNNSPWRTSLASPSQSNSVRTKPGNAIVSRTTSAM